MGGAHAGANVRATPPLSMAVNVSACQLQRPEFIDEVRGALRESEIPPNSLTLELTESVMMQDMELSLLRLNALRALGVKLAIDDFGTGYSSLNYLRQFPIDILKIDRSFLADPNPESAELTEAIVAAGPHLQARGRRRGRRERRSAGAACRGSNCDYGQGFHFARPLSGEQILAMATAARSPAQVIELHAGRRLVAWLRRSAPAIAGSQPRRLFLVFDRSSGGSASSSSPSSDGSLALPRDQLVG